MITKFYERLRSSVDALKFSYPVERIYNPLVYAWDGFRQYISRYCAGRKRVVFLGMNPGPWGMAQTGIPFGEVDAVKNFLGLTDIHIAQPENMHPSYIVNGLECRRSEVSGRRLWKLFRDRFGSADSFFLEHIVLNYCPLLFLTDGAREGRLRNLTPDRLKISEREELFALCDECLREVVSVLRPEYVVGVGSFSAKRAAEALRGVEVVRIVHPSPASPASNRDWERRAAEQLINSGVWQ